MYVHRMYNMSVNNDDPRNRTLFNLIKITLVYPLNPLWLLDSVSYRNLVLIRLENHAVRGSTVYTTLYILKNMSYSLWFLYTCTWYCERMKKIMNSGWTLTWPFMGLSLDLLCEVSKTGERIKVLILIGIETDH